MSDGKLHRIGQNIACSWGGSLIAVQEVQNGYKFTIAENGEVFTTTLTKEQIEKYDY